MLDPIDTLRPLDKLCEPDKRTRFLVRIESPTGKSRPITAADQHGAVILYRLNSTVPEEVVVHFETAKNLYLYAWFVFRFYPVAEQQALASLEFALRERLTEFVREHEEKHPKAPVPSLRKLLRVAIDTGVLRNDAFPKRDQWALQRAKHRFLSQRMREMIAAGLDEMTVDDSKVQPDEEDLGHDWLGAFSDAIPDIRNNYAHGSSTLHHTVLHTFDLVSQMINQLFPNE